MATPSEIDEQKQAWIINEIVRQNKEKYSKTKSFSGRFEFHVPDEKKGIPDYQEQESLLTELEHYGVIKIMELLESGMPFTYHDKELNIYIPKTFSARIEILQPQFEILKKTKIRKNKSEYSSSNKINKLEILESNDKKNLRVFLNEDYSSENINPLKTDIYWSMLIKIAKNKKLIAGNARGFVDFFNKNKKNILYTHSNFSLSSILKRDEKTVSSLIPILIITDKALKQRKNKNA